MKNPSVLLVILSLLFLVIPIIQQMIKVNQENKLALVADIMPEADESSSEYGDTDTEDLDVFSCSKTEFYSSNEKGSKNSSISLSSSCERKLESPPPQA